MILVFKAPHYETIQYVIETMQLNIFLKRAIFSNESKMFSGGGNEAVPVIKLFFFFKV